MTGEITIPTLPCRSIDETLTFYVALGFEITYQQARPNTYACVRRGAIELHFFSMKDYEPANSYSTCVVLVPDINELHQDFAAGLRQHYGKVLVAGIPRLTKPNNKNASGDYRFNVIDPGGNWIRFVQNTKNADTINESPSPKTVSTKLSRAILSADFLTNTKGEYAQAANVLDAALTHNEPAPSVQRVQALVLRAELAITLNDQPLARTLLAQVQQISLDVDERAALGDELEKANDLEQMLQ